MTSKSNIKRKKAGAIIVAIFILLVAAVLLLYVSFKHYKDPYQKEVAQSGFVEKTVQIGSANINYAEGPDNGPPLMLLHAQHMDWYSYSRVLPELSKSFHVYAVDYHGHGKTKAPVDAMNANAIGNDLALFMDTVIEEPAFVSGNSSGGILTAWLASNRPDLVRAIVLEDPPLFASEYPRVLETIADRSFAICYDFIQEGGDDFMLYWIDRCSTFFKNRVGFNISPILSSSVQAYRRSNPGEAVEIMYLPTTVRLMMRGMNYYDPHFGAAFHDGSWNRDFDHAEALAKIECPTLLIHANFTIQEDGTLNGAIDQDEADRIVALIPGAQYIKVDADHVTHLDKPEQYISIVEDFFRGK